MLIDLVLNAISRIKSSQVYSLSTKDKQVIDKTFDKLQLNEKLNYVIETTSFNYSIFIV